MAAPEGCCSSWQHCFMMWLSPRPKPLARMAGRIFSGMANWGRRVAASILERLRFSSKEVKLVEVMVREHLRPTQMSQGGLPSHRAIYRYFRDTEEAGIDILFLSLADHLATRGPKLNRAGWQEHAQIVNYVLTQHLEQERLVVPTQTG